MNVDIPASQSAAPADSAQAGIRMDAETLEALKGSIAKWEAIVAGTGTDEGPGNCPLCQMFIDNFKCSGCPVAQAVNDHGCGSTPYDLYSQADEEWELDEAERSANMAAAAKAELDFLKSLLPKEAAT